MDFSTVPCRILRFSDEGFGFAYRWDRSIEACARPGLKARSVQRVDSRRSQAVWPKPSAFVSRQPV